jgi:hypothetical protein
MEAIVAREHAVGGSLSCKHLQKEDAIAIHITTY